MYSQIINSAFAWCVQFLFDINNLISMSYEEINILVFVFTLLIIIIPMFIYIFRFRRTRRLLESKNITRQEPTLSGS